MTFTYDGSLATDAEKVRFYIGDTVSGTGVKPDGSNFTDEELNAVISAEGSWQSTVAAVCEVLAMLYADQVDITVGPRSEKLSQQSAQFAAMGKKWRRQYSSYSLTQVTPTRVDGFSDDVDAEEM